VICRFEDDIWSNLFGKSGIDCLAVAWDDATTGNPIAYVDTTNFDITAAGVVDMSGCFGDFVPGPRITVDIGGTVSFAALRNNLKASWEIASVTSVDFAATYAASDFNDVSPITVVERPSDATLVNYGTRTITHGWQYGSVGIVAADIQFKLLKQRKISAADKQPRWVEHAVGFDYLIDPDRQFFSVSRYIVS